MSFGGRKVIIATKHQKETVLAPILEKALGVNCTIVPNLDTDLLGTFSGEIEREDDPIATARNKCLLALEITNFDLAIASEGSFGPHPAYYFIPADEEFLLFVDKKNDLEIMASELSTDTNFSGKEIYSREELLAFAEKTKFPSHGLIMKDAQNHFTDLVKGITEYDRLMSSFEYFMTTYGKVYVETDMRAMYNPTRMKVIEKAALQLIEKIRSLCPHCSTPGFWVIDTRTGLPCQLCHAPTRSVYSHIYACQKCFFTSEKKFPHGKYTEDPMYCDHCNP